MTDYEPESRWDVPELEPWERVGWEEQQREWPDEDESDEGGQSDPRPDPRTHPEYWRE